MWKMRRPRAGYKKKNEVDDVEEGCPNVDKSCINSDTKVTSY